MTHFSRAPPTMAYYDVGKIKRRISMPVFDNVISKLQYRVVDLITSSALVLKIL